MANKKLTAYRRGYWAEIWAIFYLWMKGYKILAWRYKTKHGEIDVVASKGNVVVFVEVKARSNISDALGSVNRKNRVRVENAAQIFILKNKRYELYSLNFAVVAIEFGYKFIPRKFTYLDNAWGMGA